MTKAEEYINSIPKFAGKTELKNTEILLDELGIDTSQMKIIHVAGTNGKGSVCSYISNTLVKAGYKTGLFISPHLVKINERIQIDNVPVSDEIFDAAYEKVLKAAHRMEQSGGKHPAYFEFLFGMAIYVLIAFACLGFSCTALLHLRFNSPAIISALKSLSSFQSSRSL